MHKDIPISSSSRFSRLMLASILLVGICVWAALNVWTAPLGLAWHLFHGQFAFFHGHPIKVPWDMFVLQSGGGNITILREAPRYAVLGSPSGLMIMVRVPRQSAGRQGFGGSAPTYLQPPKEYQPSAGQKIELGQNVFCSQYERADLPRFYIACSSTNDSFVYEGDARYCDSFYSGVTAASKASY